MRVCLFTIALALAACTTGPQRITGAYADRLSRADISQIRSLVAKNRYLDRRIVEVRALAPDRLRVRVGGENDYGEGTRYNTFTVIKRGDQWISDPSAASEMEMTVVTY